MPIATGDDIRRWSATLFRVDTWPEFDTFKNEVLSYDLPDPDPASDQGAESPSVRSRAFGLIAAAAAQCAQKEKFTSYPAGFDIYKATRREPIGSSFMLAWGMFNGEQAVLIPVASMHDPDRAYYFDKPAVSPGHFAQIKAQAEVYYNRIKTLSFPLGTPEYQDWRRRMDHLEAIIVHGDLPGPWVIRNPAAGYFSSARVSVL